MEGVRSVAAAVGGRTRSAVEVAREALDRIERLNPRLGSFLEVSSERALSEAAAVDARVAAGERLPLAGVPLAIKDNIWVDGRLATCASRILGSFRPPGGRDGRRAPPPGRRRLRRQDEPGRVRHGLFDGEQRPAIDAKPLGPGAHPRRLFRRERLGRRGADGPRSARVRYRRLDPPARRVLRGGRNEALLRPGLAIRARGVRLFARPDRSPDARSLRRGAAVRGDGGGRPARFDRRGRPRGGSGRGPRTRGLGHAGRLSRGGRVGGARSPGRRESRGVPPRLRAGRRPGDDRLGAPCGRRDRDLLRRRVSGGLLQPGSLRRRALRPARVGRGSDLALRRDAHAWLRAGGQATHPARHLRALRGILRGLLRPRDAGAGAPRSRLRGGVPEGRRDRVPVDPVAGVPARREGRRSAPDVSLRRLHGPRLARGAAGRIRPFRPFAGRPARSASRSSPRASRRSGCSRRPGPSSGRSSFRRTRPPGSARSGADRWEAWERFCWPRSCPRPFPPAPRRSSSSRRGPRRDQRKQRDLPLGPPAAERGRGRVRPAPDGGSPGASRDPRTGRGSAASCAATRTIGFRTRSFPRATGRSRSRRSSRTTRPTRAAGRTAWRRSPAGRRASGGSRSGSPGTGASTGRSARPGRSRRSRPRRGRSFGSRRRCSSRSSGPPRPVSPRRPCRSSSVRTRRGATGSTGCRRGRPSTRRSSFGSRAACMRRTSTRRRRRSPGGAGSRTCARSRSDSR